MCQRLSSVLSSRRVEGALPARFCTLLIFIGIAGGLAFTSYPAEPLNNGLRVQQMNRVSAGQHGPMQLHRRRDQTSVESYNWAGYVISAPNVTDVKGSWVVPAATNCPTSTPPNEGPYASFWVGIDGWTSNTVEQIGTDSDCVNLADTVGNTPTYYAWYEFYPKFPYNLVCTPRTGQGCVNPGDIMFAEVSSAGKKFTVYIADYGPASKNNQSPVWTYSTSSSAAGAKQSSAEWIAETPYGCATQSRFCLLTDFADVVTLNTPPNTINYGSAAANIPKIVTGSATVGGVTAPLGSTLFENGLQYSTMVADQTGTPTMATPSTPVSTPNDCILNNCGDTSFTVTWGNVGP